MQMQFTYIDKWRRDPSTWLGHLHMNEDVAHIDWKQNSPYSKKVCMDND